MARSEETWPRIREPIRRAARAQRRGNWMLLAWVLFIGGSIVVGVVAQLARAL